MAIISFLHDFEGGANIYLTIKSNSTAVLMSDVNFLCMKMTLASYSYHFISKEAPVLVPTGTVAIAVAMEVVVVTVVLVPTGTVAIAVAMEVVVVTVVLVLTGTVAITVAMEVVVVITVTVVVLVLKTFT